MNTVVTDSLLRRWWNRRVNFPDPARSFVPTSRFDLLRSMRSMLRLTVAALVLFVAMIGYAVAGFSLPPWISSAFSFVAVVMMFTVLPPARFMALSLLLSSVRPKWSEAWFEAGVPLARLWTVLGSPVPVDLFAQYATALDGDTSARLDGGVDPRLVWYLHGVGMDPDLLARYAGHGLAALDAVAARDAGIDVDDWEMLKRAGLADLGSPKQVALFVAWVRGSRASVHPDDFQTETGRSRSLEACVPVMMAWARLSGFRLGVVAKITGVRDGVLMHKPSNVADGPTPFVMAIVGRRRMGEWVEMAGLLAPHFIEAGIGLEEAAEMVSAPGGAPRVEDLVFLAAWESNP